MSHPSLREFIQPVPIITVTESLATVLDLFVEHGYEHAIAHCPAPLTARLLRLNILTAYLLNKGWTAHAETPSAVNLQATLQDFTEANLDLQRVALQPLANLPADWELDQVWQHLHTTEPQPWAVVDANGHYLGLLDQPRLWTFLSAQLSLPAWWSAASAPAALTPTTPTPLTLTGDAIAPPTFSLDPSAQINSPNPTVEQLPAGSPLPAIPLPLLIPLLNQLPLPLMLQTSNGQVLTQNYTWHEQLGSLLYAHGKESSAAIALDVISENLSIDELYARRIEDRHSFSEVALPEQLLPPDSHPTSHLPSATNPHPSANQWDVRHPRMSTTLPLPTCQLDALPENGICVCSLDDAQERIWQFVKVSLGTVSAAESLASRGNETLWLFLAQDITDQQHITQELAAKNADLTQLNRLKDEFLSCISHELKTPLTAVLGLSSLLKDQAIGGLNDRQKRYAQLIYQSGRHLMMIVNNILDLTRIETDQLDLVLESVSIQSVCQRAYEQACQLQIPESVAEPQREIARTPAPSFKLAIQPGLEQIIADDLRLRQMLVNLLTNALKFTPPDGKIGLDVESWDGWLAFTVWDTGIGIPADKQHLIFQKFQQLENPFTRQFEGTGLGLVLTQRLARLHGGEVTFTSVAGKGSRFTLLLPPNMAHIASVNSVEKSQTAPLAVQRLVLVVESVPKFLEELTAYLGQLGYRVAIARSGTEALEKIRCLQPAAVFLNPLLPLLSGWDVLTLLTANPETRAIPIMVTGTHAEKKRALANGARSFLSLPIQLDMLQQTLETVLQPMSLAGSTPSPSKPSPFSGTLTVLHLRVGMLSEIDASSVQTSASSSAPSTFRDPSASLPPDLAILLHTYPCRVLEVDDLEQADLLARVWHPNVLLLNGVLPNPLQYLTQLSHHPDLASLPLITLTPENTQAANQIANLNVFPCLASLTAASDTGDADPANVSALFQVIQVASGQQ